MTSHSKEDFDGLYAKLRSEALGALVNEGHIKDKDSVFQDGMLTYKQYNDTLMELDGEATLAMYDMYKYQRADNLRLYKQAVITYWKKTILMYREYKRAIAEDPNVKEFVEGLQAKDKKPLMLITMEG